MSTSEQELRPEAIRRHLSGERRIDICRDLGQSPRWFDKWWSAFEHDPHLDFADHSRAPVTRPTATPVEIEQLIVERRKRLETADHGLIGARAIWGQLAELKVSLVPSLPTIQRVLARHSLTHPLGAANGRAYYPWLPVWNINAVQATDIITKHLRGGAEVQNFHTIDLRSHAVCLSQQTDKSAATACAHLLNAWETLGLPRLHQFDNEAAFCGGHTHPRVITSLLHLHCVHEKVRQALRRQSHRQLGRAQALKRASIEVLSALVSIDEVSTVYVISLDCFNPLVEDGFVDVAAREPFQNRLVNHLPDAAQLFTRLIDFVDDVGHESQVGLVVAGEVKDEDIARLAVTVYAAIAVLQSHRVPGNLLVENIPAACLQVDSFRSDIRGQENAERALGIIERFFSSCHCRCNEAGQMTRTRRIRPRANNSDTINPASIVFPSPTSPATSSDTLGMSSDLSTGSI